MRFPLPHRSAEADQVRHSPLTWTVCPVTQPFCAEHDDGVGHVHGAAEAPYHLPGHHVALMKREVAAVHAVGQMTAPEVARALGIGPNGLKGLERRLGLVVPRTGKHKLRSYTPEHVEALRAAVVPLGTEPGVSLFYMHDIAKRAGRKPHTIAHRRGVDLPAGRWVTHPHRGWVFTADELEQAVDQLKRWPRLSKRRRSSSTSPSAT